jgi:protein-S-isoprenylcysteine O-methyltransferase Ste14
MARWAVFGAYMYLLLGAGFTFRKTGNSAGRTLPLIITIWILGAQSQRDEPYMMMAIPAGVLILISLLLFTWAAKTVRGKFFSYLGDQDVPQFVCEEGPFVYVRHPFYASYILTNTGVALLFPNWITAAAAVASYGILWYTSKFEERKFEGSPVADEYRAYMTRTGRFFPRAVGG